MKAWRRWVQWSGREEDARGQAWSRTLVCVVAVLSAANVTRLGLVDTVYRKAEDGGIAVQVADTYVLDEWLGPEGGAAAWGAMLVAFLLALTGRGSRWFILLGVLAWAQCGHLWSPADRAIDRILRFVLFVLVLGAVPRPTLRPGARVPAWPADLVRWLLVIVYLSAGIGKVGNNVGWLLPTEWPSLYRCVADPLDGRLDPVAAAGWMPLWLWGGRATILLELSSPLILTRWAPWWALFGAGMHLGIAGMMDLGWFPWGMLALYPLLFQRWLEPTGRGG